MGATDAEALLWALLRRRQLGGAKFRRQHQFGSYILDFYCNEARLAVEVDGGQHSGPEGVVQDGARTEFLQSCGVNVLRF